MYSVRYGIWDWVDMDMEIYVFKFPFGLRAWVDDARVLVSIWYDSFDIIIVPPLGHVNPIMLMHPHASQLSYAYMYLYNNSSV